MNIEQTADGSYTLYVPELDEHYHSVKGPLVLLRRGGRFAYGQVV